MKEKTTEGIWDQFKNNKAKPYKGGITIDHIKEAVECIFNQERYKVESTGLGYFIDVISNEDQFSFSVCTVTKSSERITKLKTGVRGFLNLIEKQPLIKLLFPIRLNGIMLNKKGLGAFWDEIFEIKNKLDNEKIKG